MHQTRSPTPSPASASGALDLAAEMNAENHEIHHGIGMTLQSQGLHERARDSYFYAAHAYPVTLPRSVLEPMLPMLSRPSDRTLSVGDSEIHSSFPLALHPPLKVFTLCDSP
eukprot:7386336-Prymnesium_polylepis.2